MSSTLVIFIFVMWILLLVGGGILVTILGPISISGYDSVITSIIQAVIALILVMCWIFILLKTKNWIFRKQIKF